MKRALLVIGLALFIQCYTVAFSININVTVPGTLSTLLSASQKTTLTDLTVTGCIDARDVKCMRDEMPLLAILDLSTANIMAYTGTAGTYYSSTKSIIYPANQMPANSFLMSGTNAGKATLKSLKFPDSLTSIGVQVCYSCTGLTGTLVIPASVTSIGSLAFYNCSGLSKIIVDGATPPAIQFSTFMNVNKSTCILNVPLGARLAYKSANYWNEFTAIIEPFSVLVSCSAGGEIIVNTNTVIKDNSVIPVNPGSSLTFTFSSNTNYRLAGLTYDGVNVASKVVNNQYTTPAVSKNAVVLATFALKQYNLLIKNSEGGSTKLICDYGATPTFDLNPSEGKKIDAVFFNDQDVTASLIDGVFTVPPITDNSTLKVVYSTLTGLRSESTVDMKIYTGQSEIIIDDSGIGDIVRVYTMLGKEIEEIKSNGERIIIPLAKGGLYIVKVDNKTTKVVL